MRLSEARAVAADAEAALRTNGASFLLSRRAGLAHLAARNYSRSAFFVNRCLRLKPNDPYCKAMRNMLGVLQGDIASGEVVLVESFGRLSPDQASTLLRVTRQIVRHAPDAGRPGNVVNEFLLDQSLRAYRERTVRA